MKTYKQFNEGFVGGLSGSIIGTALILYLSARELIDLKLIF